MSTPPNDPPSNPLLLDADPAATLRRAAGTPRALGRDPFDEVPAPDPLLEWPGPLQPEAGSRSDDRVMREPDAEGWQRLLRPHERRQLARLLTLERDSFGLSPVALERAFPFFYALYRLYFRVRSVGHEHIPSRGGAILASNHGGLLPFDGAMIVVDSVLGTDPPRLPRTLVDRFASRVPLISEFFPRVGQVPASRANFRELLREQQLVLVFPEGIEGIRKPITQRYRLQSFRPGFIEEALRAQVPVLPMAVIGAEDQAPVLYDLKGLAKRLGLPTAPITPTFPWFGPLGLLPYPVSYRIVYGEPLCFHDDHGPEAAEDPDLVDTLSHQVRRAIQRLLDHARS